MDLGDPVLAGQEYIARLAALVRADQPALLQLVQNDARLVKVEVESALKHGDRDPILFEDELAGLEHQGIDAGRGGGLGLENDLGLRFLFGGDLGGRLAGVWLGLRGGGGGAAPLPPRGGGGLPLGDGGGLPSISFTSDEGKTWSKPQVVGSSHGACGTNLTRNAFARIDWSGKGGWSRFSRGAVVRRESPLGYT